MSVFHAIDWATAPLWMLPVVLLFVEVKHEDGRWAFRFRFGVPPWRK